MNENNSEQTLLHDQRARTEIPRLSPVLVSCSSRRYQNLMSPKPHLKTELSRYSLFPEENPAILEVSATPKPVSTTFEINVQEEHVVSSDYGGVPWPH